MEDPKETIFNLNNKAQGITRELAPGINTRIFTGEQAMLSVVNIDPGAEGKPHRHPEEQWGLMLEGTAVRYQGDSKFSVKKGDFWRTPGGVIHTIKAGSSGAIVLDIFSPPREEYRKAGSGFGVESQ